MLWLNRWLLLYDMERMEWVKWDMMMGTGRYAISRCTIITQEEWRKDEGKQDVGMALVALCDKCKRVSRKAHDRKCTSQISNDTILGASYVQTWSLIRSDRCWCGGGGTFTFTNIVQKNNLSLRPYIAIRRGRDILCVYYM